MTYEKELEKQNEELQKKLAAFQLHEEWNNKRIASRFIFHYKFECTIDRTNYSENDPLAMLTNWAWLVSRVMVKEIIRNAKTDPKILFTYMGFSHLRDIPIKRYAFWIQTSRNYYPSRLELLDEKKIFEATL